MKKYNYYCDFCPTVVEMAEEFLPDKWKSFRIVDITNYTERSCVDLTVCQQCYGTPEGAKIVVGHLWFNKLREKWTNVRSSR